MRAQEGIKFKRGVNENTTTRKVSNMLNSANQKNPKMNNGERK
jgi:hypothetical protein